MTIKKPGCILDELLTILVGYLSRFPSHPSELKEMSTVSICSDNPVESEYGSIPSHHIMGFDCVIKIEEPECIQFFVDRYRITIIIIIMNRIINKSSRDCIPCLYNEFTISI